MTLFLELQMTPNGRNTKRRVAASAIVAGLLGTALLLPTPAFALTTTRSYTWNDGEQQPTASQTVSENGTTYTLQSTSTPVKSGSNQTLTQYFTTTTTSTVSADQIGNVQSIVPGNTQYSQDGYSGSLKRTSIDYTPIYVNQDRTETGSRSGTAVGGASAHPDDSVVPSTTYQNGHQMNRASVSWTKGAGDNDGAVWNYTAEYSGSYKERVLDHYDVIASYGGDLSKTVNNGSWSMTATYAAPDPQENNDNAGNTETLNDDQNTADEQQNQENAQNENTENAGSNENADNENVGPNSNNNGNSGMTLNTGNVNTNGTDANAGGVGGFFSGVLNAFKANPLLLLIPLALLLALIALIVVLAKRGRKDATVATAGAAVAPIAVPADIYAVSSELIEFVDDGTDDNQHVVATCDATLSPDENTPSLIEIPVPPARFEPSIATDTDGNKIMDENGNVMTADYYVVLGDMSQAVVATATTNDDGVATITGIADGKYALVASEETLGNKTDMITVKNGAADDAMFVLDGSESMDMDDVTRDALGLYPGNGSVTAKVTDADGNPLGDCVVDLLPAGLLEQAKSDRLVIASNGYAIYDGVISDQVKVDGKALANALNDEPTDEMVSVSDDIDAWHKAYDKYDDDRSATIERFYEQQEQQEQGQAEEYVTDETSGLVDDEYSIDDDFASGVTATIDRNGMDDVYDDADNAGLGIQPTTVISDTQSSDDTGEFVDFATIAGGSTDADVNNDDDADDGFVDFADIANDNDTDDDVSDDDIVDDEDVSDDDMTFSTGMMSAVTTILGSNDDTSDETDTTDTDIDDLFSDMDVEDEDNTDK